MPGVTIRDVADKINALYLSMAREELIQLGFPFRLRRTHFACMANRVMLRQNFLDRVTDALLELHGLVLIDFDLVYFVVAPTGALDNLPIASNQLVAPYNSWPTWYDGTPIDSEATEVYMVATPIEEEEKTRG